MFRLNCPHCQTPFRASARFLGRNIPCPKCKQTINIPAPVGMAAPAITPGCVGDVTRPEENKLRSRRSPRQKKAVLALLAALLLLMFVTAVSIVLLLRPHPSPSSVEGSVGGEVGGPPAVGDLDGIALVRALDKAMKELDNPTVNEFKRQKGKEQYQAFLHSFRGREIRLALPVAFVTRSRVVVTGLTADPQLFEKVQVMNRHSDKWILPPTSFVYFDFSGKDHGTNTYEVKRRPDATMSNFAPFGPRPETSPPEAEEEHIRFNTISSASLEAAVLADLDRGHSLFIKGQIVSLVPYRRGQMLDYYANFLLSLKMETLTVRQPSRHP